MNKSKKTTQKIESKQRILNVAARLFRKQGFKATGIDQLMHESGLTAGAFYAHFDSKEDLFEQTLNFALEQSKKLLFKESENLSDQDKTKAVIARYCSDAHRDFPDRGCILPALAAEIYQGSIKSSHLIAGYIEKWTDHIVCYLSNGLSENERRTLALQLISRSVGAVLLSRVTREHSLSNDILRAAQEV